MAQTHEGARLARARKLGMTVDQYIERCLTEKWCTGCKAWHPLPEFGADRSRFDGLSSKCRVAAYRRVTDRPGTRERRDHAARGEKWCGRCRLWMAAALVDKNGLCRPHANEAYREHYAANPTPIIRRVNARARGVAPVPPDADMVAELFDYSCAYCGGPFEAWDHVVPVVKGGLTEPGNMLPACRRCNSSKKDRDVLAWVEARSTPPHEHLADYLSMLMPDAFAEAS